MKNIPLSERIIFALDTASLDQAKAWVRLLGPRINYFKVGLQLFLAHGFTIVDWVLDQGHKLMLDLKFLDIPQTVGLAMAEAARHGAHLATVHAHTTGTLRAAVSGAGNTGVLGVTVLTSVGPEEVRELRCDASVEELVSTRAGYALAAGCAGVVASGLEAQALRREYGQDFLIVTPGIRSAGHDLGDQRRVLTPGRALAYGADHLVVGRPISQAQDPVAEAEAMLAEVAQTVADLGPEA
jgi:orotidine-5'-phosphate decarboxylase